MNDSYLLPRSPSRALDSRSLARHPAGWLRLVLLTAALAGSVSSQAQFRILSFDPQPDGQVNALAVQPDGKILVGGDFTHIGGQARNSLARLRPDGSVDGAFQPTIDVNNLYGDAVFCLAVRPDGKLLLGGNFGSFDGGSSNPCLALLLPNGEHDWWDFYGAPRDWIGALAVQPDGKILVAYTSYGLDRFWPDGSWDSTFNSPTTGASTVNCLAVQADGKILLGGRFTTLNGQTRNYLGRLKADGNLDDTFNPNANGEVRTLLVEPSGKIVVGGDFTQIGGQSRAYVARLEASGNVETWSYTGYLTGANGPVRSLALQADGGVLVGGYFNTLGGQNCDAGLGRLMTDGSIDFSFNLGNEIGGVTSLALQPDGNILVAGNLWYEVYVGNALELVRLSNPTPATQDITNTADTIIWLRGGSSPEVWRTTFECSTDGVNWTPLGAGTRIPGGWELTGLSVPAGANVRARGWVTGGNGSVWFVESVVAPAGTPPGIVTQPVSVSVCAGAGQGTSFSVVAGGNGPFTYQWRKGGVNLADGGVSGGYIADTTTPTLQLSGLNEAMNGDYSVVVGNSCGSVTSVVATLTVLGPSIITQPAPASQWRQRGESVTFSVAVMDSLPVTYQWFKDGLALPGRTEPTLTLTDLQRGDAGSYDVVVANPFCIVASAVAVLKVNLVVPDTFHFGSGLERADCSRLAIQPDGRILAWGSITLFGVPPFSAFFRLNPDGVSDLGFKASGARSLNSLHLQPDGKILLHVSQDALSRMNPNGTYDDGFKSWGGFYYGGVPPLHEYLESCVMDADGRTLLLYVHSDTVNQTWFCNVRILGECIRYISIDVHEPWRFSLAQLNNAGREQQVLGSGSSDLPFPAAVNAMAFQPNGQMLIGYGPWTPGYRPPQLLARLNVNGALDPSFAPAIGGGDYVDKILVQPDGKILVAGNFDTLGGQPRKLLGRLNADGTLDKDFDAKVDGEIETIFIQTDGKILLQGAFSSVQGQPRSSVARLNPDGTLDKEFNPEVEGSANSIAMQADGRIVVSGTFSRIGGQERLGLARLGNSDPATENLSVTPQTINWLRGGSSPEVWRTAFDASADGMNWTPLGAGTRIAGGWQLTGLSLAGQSRVRARGFVANGGTSEYFVESYAGTPVIPDAAWSAFPAPGQALTLLPRTGGSGPFSFQWFKAGQALSDGGNISGATTASLTISGANAADAGEYSLAVNNSYGSVISTVATVIFGPPVILHQPADLTVTTNQSAGFSVIADGTPALTYQWRKNGVPLPGATSASYTIASAAAGDAGSYDVVVGNSYGSVTSSVAMLFYDLPTILAQPASREVHHRDTAGFGVVADGTGPLAYQWFFNGTPLADATNSLLTIAFPRPYHAGNYAVVVTNANGAVTSAVAVLTYLSDRGTNGLNFTDGSPIPHLSGEMADGCTNWTDSWPVDSTIGAQTGNVTLPGGLSVKWDSANTRRAGLEADSEQQLYRVYLDDGDASLVTGDGIGVSVTISNLASWLIANNAVSYRIRCYASSDSSTYPAGGFLPVSVRLGAPNPADGAGQLLNLPVLETISMTSRGDGGFPTATGASGIRGYGDSSYSNTADVITLTIPAGNGSTRGTLAGLVIEYNTDSTQPPQVVLSPQSVNAAVGAAAKFQVAAIGTPPFGYLWRKDGVPLVGTNEPSFTIASVASGDLGNYDVLVGNPWGVVTSAVAVLTFSLPPNLFITCSTNLTVSASSAAGAVVTYTSSASGVCSPVNVNSVPPSGSTFPIGTTTVTCTASDACGQTTQCTFTVTVNPPSNPLVLVSAASLTGSGRIGIRFGTALGSASASQAANYSVDGGVVTAATLRPDASSVVLDVSGLTGSNFVLHVSHVKDLVGNEIALNTTVSGQMLPQRHQDVGTAGDPAAAGSTFSAGAGDFDVLAGGTDIWNKQDGCLFIHEQFTGDFDVSVRVESLDAVDRWSKAGLMVRENLTAGSRNLMIGVEPVGPTVDGLDGGQGQNDHFAQIRPDTGGLTALWTPLPPAAVLPPYPNAWIRLTRQGATFRAYRGSDGVQWTQMGQTTQSYPATVYVGLATTAHNNTAGYTALARYRSYSRLGTITTSPAFVPLGAVSLTDSRQVGVGFGRVLDPGSAPQIAKYQINGATVTGAALSPDRQGVLLTVNNFSGPNFNLTVGPVADTLGNLTPPQTIVNGLVVGQRRQDVGTAGDPAVAGITFSAGAGDFDVLAGGTDIWNNQDGCHFVHEQLTGDFDVRVRVESLDPVDRWSKAGLMVRENLTAGSRNLMVMVEPIGATWDGQYGGQGNNQHSAQIRSDSGGVTSLWILPGAAAVAPPYPNAWLRLTRQGATFRAYCGSDGVQWTQMGQTNQTYPAAVYVGLATTSHDNTAGYTGLARYRSYSRLGTVASDPAFVPLSAASLTGSGQVGVSFGRWLDLASATQIAKYQISGATVTGAVLSPDGQGVLLTVNNLSGPSFNVTVGAVADAFGNLTPPQTIVRGLVLSQRRQDVGTVGDPAVAGMTFSAGAGDFDVLAGGTDIWNGQDGFHFVHEQLTGDFDLSVRVASLDAVNPWSKAGLMVRENLTAGSRHLYALVTPTGPTRDGQSGMDQYLAQMREAANGSSTDWALPGVNLAWPAYPNAWIRLQRQGATFRAYRGPDGVQWTQIAQTNQTYPAIVYVGLATTAHNNAAGYAALARYRDYASLVQPQITTQPQSVTVFQGGTATFQVAASGTPPLVFQWRKSGIPLPGANLTSLTFSPVQVSDAGSYDVVVTNFSGSVTSVPAVLTISAALTLSVHKTGPGTIRVEWTAPGCILQVAPAVTGPWTTLSTATSPYDTTIPPMKIFRLIQ